MIKELLVLALLSDINTYRTHHHLAALEMNSYLSMEAEKHSLEMAENIIPFGHEGFKTRAQKIFARFTHAEGIAENVAYTSEDPKTVTPLWLKSPGHRTNIEGNYNLTGIGMAQNKNGVTYVTQIFIHV